MTRAPTTEKARTPDPPANLLADELAAPPVRHLLVDLDGTLLGNHALPLGVDFLTRAFRQLRAHGSFAQIARALLDIQLELARPSSKLTNDVRVIERFAKRLGLSAEEGRRVLREGVLVIFPELKKHFYPMEGAAEFLTWARGRYPLTLATNPVWPPEIVELRVRWAGIDPAVFGAMTSVRTMKACKPEVRYFEEILEQQGLTAGECLLIGDNLKMDRPATRAGIRVFIVGPKGPLGKLPPLKLPAKNGAGARTVASAWRGSFEQLRAALRKAAEVFNG